LDLELADMKTIIEMAREAGFTELEFYGNKLGTNPTKCLERFAELVRADERERPWVGLTGQEKAWIASVSLDVHDAVHRTEAKLKEKNT
jgi:hypothetical protein